MRKQMKKLLLFAFAGLTLIACDDDSGDNGGGTTTPNTKEQIIGDWNGDEVELRQVIPGIIDTSETLNISYYTLTFNENLTGRVDSSGILIEYFDWDVLANNDLVFFEDTFEIDVLNGTNFNFTSEEVEDIGQGMIMTFTQTYKLVK